MEPAVRRGVTTKPKGQGIHIAAVRAGLLAILFTLPLLLACSGKTPPAGLEVTITSKGLQPPTDFDAVEVAVSQQVSQGGCGGGGQGDTWNQLFDVTQSVTVPASWPTTLAIQAGTNSDQDGLIVVTAFKSGQLVVSQTAQLQIPTDRVAQLVIVLAADCVGKMCPPGESCDPNSATCQSDIVNSKSLRDAGSAPLASSGSEASDGSSACAGNAFRPDGGACTCEGRWPTLCYYDAAPPQCVDTTLDWDNCGGCGVTCKLTAACNGAFCGNQPTQLVPPSPGCVSMRVVYDNGNIYWSDMGHGTISSIPAGGGVTTTIVPNQAMVPNQAIAAEQNGVLGALSFPSSPNLPLATPLLVRAGTVYWVGASTSGGAGTTILSATAGSVPKTLLTTAMDPAPSPISSAVDAAPVIETAGQSPPINAIALSPDGSTLYFAAGTRFYSIPTTGAGEVTYVGYAEGPEHGEATALVSDDSYLYYPTNLSGNVEILSLTSMCGADAGETCPLRVVNSRPIVPDTLVVRGDSLYWGESFRVVQASISAFLSGPPGIEGTSLPGTVSSADLTGFAIGTQYAYFGEPGADDTGYVERGAMPPFESGSTPSAIVIARGQPWPTSFALDGAHVYWTTSRCDISYIADAPQ
jgi:uncharacterized ParB-like nuclease family protein